MPQVRRYSTYIAIHKRVWSNAKPILSFNLPCSLHNIDKAISSLAFVFVCLSFPALVRYEFLYKQAVATEDVYLGMSDKDPSSTSCEDLVLKVYLEGTQSMSELDLDVEDTHVKVRSPR